MKKYEYKFFCLNGNALTEKQLKVSEHEKDKYISMEQLNNFASEGWRVINANAHKDFIAGFMNVLLERERFERLEKPNDPLQEAIDKATEEHGYKPQLELEAPTQRDPYVTKTLDSN